VVGLTYSLPPPSLEGEERQKFRDEGLILVGDAGQGGIHPYVEKTPKYYAFEQFAHFIRPGWVRVKAEAPPNRLVAAFRSPDSKRLAVVVLNPDKSPIEIEPRIVGAASYRPAHAYVTDREHRCESMPWTGSLTGESITTLTYQVE
jgi:hypothetical protein